MMMNSTEKRASIAAAQQSPVPLLPKPHEEEPGYREHGIIVSGQQPVEAPSFYPADLFERQEREAQQLLAQPQLPLAPGHPSSAPGYPAPPINQGYPTGGYPPPANRNWPGTPGQPLPYTNPQTYQAPVPRPNYPQPPVYQQPYRPPVGYPGYPYPQGYYPQGYYPAPYGVWQPPKPARDGYQLGIGISALIGSVLAILGGGFCLLVVFISGLTTTSSSSPLASTHFASTILYSALALAGIVGGAFGVFHSICAIIPRRSRALKLPPFWFFLLLYLVMIVVDFMVGTSSFVISNTNIAFLMIALSGILPALTFYSLALWRVRQPGTGAWPTTWRRFSLALVSGATSAILFAIILELILTIVAFMQSGISLSNLINIDNPNAPVSNDPRVILFTLMIVSVIAPLVEETMKPLAAITMIGRMRSAAEAFMLGMACGIGFDMIETVQYMGMGVFQVDQCRHRS